MERTHPDLFADDIIESCEFCQSLRTFVGGRLTEVFSTRRDLCSLCHADVYYIIQRNKNERNATHADIG